ncbi:type II toxin-antitoxin system RelE/ParE family toxin [Belliella pelovolcani]|uniref:type II toxin-antitoxin system RelE/ParE family toxin n=1 Tax=Belliella pelovolcani TaxID=529505 RepID=UPI00391AC7E0
MQLDFIARHRPIVARKFKDELIQKLKWLSANPYRCRVSIYFDDLQIRDLIFRHHTITYKIFPNEKLHLDF